MGDKAPKILLVDDEKEIIELLQEAIEEDLKLPVVTATNGDEAISLLQRENIRIIISDYKMPFVTGGELFLYNKSHNNLPFIFVSADFVEKCPELIGFLDTNPHNRFMSKPVKYELLMDYIRDILKSGGKS